MCNQFLEKSFQTLNDMLTSYYIIIIPTYVVKIFDICKLLIGFDGEKLVEMN